MKLQGRVVVVRRQVLLNPLPLVIALAMSASLFSVASAQVAGAPSVERIRAQAQRMKEYRDLLNDRDSNVRVAALDEMLKSNDSALREVAYDAAFTSADQNLRAIALRSKIRSMKALLVELENRNRLPEEQWANLVSRIGSSISFVIVKFDDQTGVFAGDTNNRTGMVSGHELSLSYSTDRLKLRLGDGGVMHGHYANSSLTVPVRLALH